MATPAPYRLHRSLGYQLSLTARIQEQRLEDGLRGLGLTRITWCILLAAGIENLSQPSEIAKFIGIDRTATSRALRQMEADGLIGRSDGTSDRRTTTVALTQAGHTRLRAAEPFARENLRIYRDRLTDAEHAELHRLLAKLREGEPAGLERL